MTLSAADFANTSANFSKVTFNVTPGYQTITKRNVTLTSVADKKVYDGTALKNSNVTVSGDGFANGEGANCNVTGSQTLVGSSENTFTYELNKGTLADNYTITTVFGTLTVTDGTGEDEDPVDPKLVVTKAAEDKTYKLAEVVTFQITATNIYEDVKTITLSEIEGVTLAQSTFADVKGGDTIETTATYTITEEDILNGSFTNTVTATMDKLVKTADATVTTEKKNGHVTINKVTTSETPEDGYALGAEISYEITAINDGNLTVTGVKVTDELTGDEWTIESLKPGESKAFEAKYTVTEADILTGEVVNIATATGTTEDPGEPDVPVEPGEDPEPTEKKNDHVTITKAATSTPANGQAYIQGEVITYAITATNDGNLTITDITVTDELTGDEWTIESLAPGANETFETSYTVTLQDAMAGTVVNVATATGTSPDPENPEATVEPGEDPEPTEVKQVTLIINYWQNGELINTVNRTEPAGTAYDVMTPPIEGYTANIERVTGILEKDEEIFDVVYTQNDYTLTILYRFNNGTQAAADYTATLHFGDAYTVQSPAIGGFNTATATVNGTMPAGDVTITVLYVPNANVVNLFTIEDFETPLGTGLGGVNAGESIE